MQIRATLCILIRKLFHIKFVMLKLHITIDKGKGEVALMGGGVEDQ